MVELKKIFLKNLREEVYLYINQIHGANSRVELDLYNDIILRQSWGHANMRRSVLSRAVNHIINGQD